MKRIPSSLGVAVSLLAITATARPTSAAESPARPNIVVILADDLGYGDVRCLNREGKIATPHMDRLATEGMIFTDAHTPSAVCSPTRYGLLTGRYSWRTRLKQGVLGGYSRPLIEPSRLTVAALLKQRGYRTACFGKWHLGMDMPMRGGGVADDGGNFSNGYAEAANVDYAGRIQNGPTAVGFDTYYGISGSLDMVPFLFIADDHFTELPTTEKKWIRKGLSSKDFEAIDVLPVITRKAVEYIDRQAADARSGRPFFVYVPLSAPHAPVLPTAPWQGKSGLNAYADFVMQTDDSVGQVLSALDRNRIAENTLVILTSDNGCSPVAKYDELLPKGHNPSGSFRGTKADIFEGGHRVPFLARWPKQVRAGSHSDRLICLADLMATCADIVGVKLPDNAGEDSISFLPALKGEDRAPREAVVHHSINGSFAIREGNWKLILCPDSGGWSAPLPNSAEAKNLPALQLYDLASDIGERRNVQEEHSEVVKRLTRLLEKYVTEGRSTPGPAQQNTTPVQIRVDAAK